MIKIFFLNFFFLSLLTIFFLVLYKYILNLKKNQFFKNNVVGTGNHSFMSGLQKKHG